MKLESVGVVLYNEFGRWISRPLITGGIYADINFFDGLNFKPELLVQSANLNNALIYSFTLEKSFDLGHSRTSLNARYIGLSAIDSNAKALNSFSNVFSGDVLRLDTPDLPVYQFGIKQSFSKYKFHLKFQATGQAKTNPLREYDLEAGKKIIWSPTDQWYRGNYFQSCADRQNIPRKSRITILFLIKKIDHGQKEFWVAGVF